MRRPSTLLPTAMALVALSALTGCGSGVRTTPPIGTVSPSPTNPIVRVGDLVAGQGMLMQRTADGPIELCVGAVAASHPPQCGGPRIVGDVDWETLAPERASGVTWTKGSVWAVGRLDPKAGTSGTFTLDRPLSLTPPAGVATPASQAPMAFPQLCDDPYAGGGSKGGGSPEAQNALTERLATLDGYVGSWVSDGSSMFNVLVTGDAAAAHTEIRKVWKGGLCVEQRDVPTEADVRAAQEALGKKSPGLLTTGGDATTGKLNVEVTVLDQATHDQIMETVKPWLEPTDVTITSAFQPLTQ